MRMGCVQNTVDAVSATGAGLLLQNPQQATGLWLGAPTDFGTPDVSVGEGLRLINPQGASGLILGSPVIVVAPPDPVEPPTINNVVATSDTLLLVSFTDNQTAPADSFNVTVTEVGVGEITGSPFNTTDNPYSIRELTASTSYDVSMTAVFGGAESGPSNTVRQATSATQVPSDLVPLKFLPMEGTVGENLSGDDYMWNSGNTTYSNTQVKYGATSARMYIAEGSDGNSAWGGGFSFPYNIGVGQEIWTSAWVFVPSNFLINQIESATTKWMRYTRRNLAGTSNGYIDLYIGGAALGNIISISAEYPADATHYAMTTLAENPWVTGTWQRWEWYVKLASDNTGTARLWKNGVLVGTRSNFKSMPSSSDWIDELKYLTYFNGTSPQDQFLYTDNIVVATSNNPPVEQDTFGNYMIGDYRG